MVVNTSPTGGQTRHDQYIHGSFHSRELLIWLRDLALEPSNMESSCHRFWNQILEVRKIMNINDAKSSQKKRNFEQYMDYDKFAYTFELTREKRSSQLVEKQRRCESASLPFSKEKCGSLEGTQGHVAFHDINDKLEYCCVCLQDYSHLSGYDEPIKGSNQVKQGNLKSHCERFENSSSYTPCLKEPIKEELKIEMFKELRSLVNEDFDDFCKNSYSLRSGKEHRKLNQPHKKGRWETESGKEDRKLDQPRKKFLPFKGNHLSRLIIPIGPRFQAETPQWEGITDIRHHNIDDDFKWFGTEILPMPIKETGTKGVGEDRHDVCSCDFPNRLTVFNNTLVKQESFCNQRLVQLSELEV